MIRSHVMKYLLALFLLLPSFASAADVTVSFNQRQLARILATYDQVLVRTQRDTIWRYTNHPSYNTVVNPDTTEGAPDSIQVSYPDSTLFNDGVTETPIYRDPRLSDIVADVNAYLKGKVITREQNIEDDKAMKTARKVSF